MKILALDTATELCSVALLIDEHMIVRELKSARGAADHILPMIDAVLAEAGVALGSLDAIAFGRGPGGFTGVRLAASVTQGLAFGAGLSVVPISDLAAVAQRALDLNATATRVLVCNDARMQQVYWACFERSSIESVPHALLLGEERVGAPEDVTVAPGEPVVGAGCGFKVYPQLRARVTVAYDDLLPRAAEVARLAAHAPRIGPEGAVPIYVRDEVARPQS